MSNSTTQKEQNTMVVCWTRRQATPHHSWSLPTEVFRAWNKDNPNNRSPECVSLDQAIGHIVHTSTEYELCECDTECPFREECFCVE